MVSSPRRGRSPLRLIRLAATALFLAALAAFSILPQSFKRRLATHGLVHDGIHIAAFLTAFWLAAGQSKNAKQAVLWALALLCFGVSLEVLQTRVYGNTLEYRDILDDAVGIGIGAGLWLITGSMRKRQVVRGRR